MVGTLRQPANSLKVPPHARTRCQPTKDRPARHPHRDRRFAARHADGTGGAADRRDRPHPRPARLHRRGPWRHGALQHRGRRGIAAGKCQILRRDQGMDPRAEQALLPAGPIRRHSDLPGRRSLAVDGIGERRRTLLARERPAAVRAVARRPCRLQHADRRRRRARCTACRRRCCAGEPGLEPGYGEEPRAPIPPVQPPPLRHPVDRSAASA